MVADSVISVIEKEHRKLYRRVHWTLLLLLFGVIFIGFDIWMGDGIHWVTVAIGAVIFVCAAIGVFLDSFE